MKFSFVKGSTSLILVVFIQDSSSTTGAGLGSLDQTSGMVGFFNRMGGLGVALAVDENVATEGTYQAPSAVGKVRIGTPANAPTGYYELHFHNDLYASGADAVSIGLGGATNMAELPLEVQLTDAPATADSLATHDGKLDTVGGIVADTTFGNEAINNNISALIAAPGVGARPFVPTTITVVTGTNPSGTASDLANDDADVYTLDDDAGILTVDFDYQLEKDTEVIQFILIAAAQGVTDDLDFQIYDQDGLSFISFGTIDGSNSLNYVTLDKITVTQYTKDGLLQTRITGTGLSSATLTVNVAVAYGMSTSRSVGYADGALWLNGNKSNTGTTPFFDGYADHPVSVWASILALRTSVGLDRVRVAAGTDIILTSDSSSMELIGAGYTVDFDGQIIDGLHVVSGEISGEGIASTNKPIFESCPVGIVTLDPFIMRDCWLEGGLTVRSTGNFYLNNCRTRTPGAAQFPIDMNVAIGGTNMSIKNASGGYSITNMAAGDVMSIGGPDMGTVTINGTGGTVDIRGAGKPYVDASGENVTIIDTGYTTKQISNLNDPTAAEIRIEMDSNSDDLNTLIMNVATLLNRVSANVALASICTEGRLAELDAANLPAVTDGIQTDLSNATDGLGALKDLLDSIRAITDQMVFTVANQLDCNVIDKTGFSVSATGLDLVLFDSLFALAMARANWTDTLTAYTDGMAGKRLKGLSAVYVVEGAVNDAGATTTSFITTLTGYGTNFFRDTEIAVELVADQWQPRVVKAYNTTTGLMTVDEPFTSAPDDASKIALTMRHIHAISSIKSEMDTALSEYGGSTHSAADVWAVATRVLTSGTNIVLAKGVGVTGFNDIDGTSVTVTTNSDKTGYALSAAGIDAVLDEVVEGTLTLRQILRIGLAVLAGKSAGGGTATITMQDVADSKARVTATVDINGNRTAITLDGT
jgi:hypothetical protein